MLVLTRDACEQTRDIVIQVGEEEILLRVVEIRGHRVRLGLVAHKSVKLHRREIFEQIHGRGPRYVPTAEETRDAS